MFVYASSVNDKAVEVNEKEKLSEKNCEDSKDSKNKAKGSKATTGSKSKATGSKTTGNKATGSKTTKTQFSSNIPDNAETLLKNADSLEFDDDNTGTTNSNTNEFALTQSPNNALITGIRGCGKSHLIMTAAAFLTARNMSDLYRIVCIGDCRAWAQSDNPVAYFSLELMMAFRSAAERSSTTTTFQEAKSASNNGTARLEDGNYNPPGIFTSFDDLKGWMEAVGRRQNVYQDLKLVIFIDQLEELYPPVASSAPNVRMAARIFELLISLKYPILIASLIPSPHTLNAIPPAVKDPALFAEMRMPAVLTYTDFDMFVEVFEASRKFSNEDDPLMHDLRMWTGGVPAQVAKFFTNSPTGLNIASRLVKYRAERARAFSDLVLSAVAKMDRLPRMHFLLQICRMILHIPSDDPQLSPGAAINGLESLFLPAALQKFYHPEEGIVAYRHIPTAVSPAAHYTLCDRRLLGKLAAKWEQVLEAVLASTLNSANVCQESKRRVIKFYTQFKLFLVSFDEELSGNVIATVIPEPPTTFTFSGINQFNDKVIFKFSTACLRRVIFAGLSPTPVLIPSGGKGNPNAANPLVFIPGRTDFCFYDFFVAIPAEKTLYAVTTCPFDLMTNNNNNNSSSNNNPNASINTATNAPLTPFTLLEMWSKDLKDAGYNKFQIKSVYIPPNDLLTQVKLQ